MQSFIKAFILILKINNDEKYASMMERGEGDGVGEKKVFIEAEVGKLDRSQLLAGK